MKTNIIKTTLGLLAATLPMLSSPASEVAYEFTTIAETGGSVASIAARGLNNRGDVLVFSQATDGSETLWQADRGTLAPVVQSPTRNSIASSTRSLSDSGRVAFLLSDLDPDTGTARSRIIVAKHDQWSTLAEAHPASDGISLGAPVINNAGAVAFRLTSATNRHIRILTIDGTQPETIIDLTPAVGAFISGPEINNEGMIAYDRTDGPDLANTPGGVFLWQEGVSVRVFDPNSQPGEFGRRLSAAPVALNDFGSVAVRTLAFANPPPPVGSPIITNRIVRVDGGVVTTIAQRTDDFRPATGFSLNNAGEVAFFASNAQGAGALYVGDGVTTQRVLGTGDTVGSRTVLRPASSVLLNERGQIVCLVTYTDGGRAIILATP